MKKNVKNLTFLSLLALMGCANNKNVVTDVNMNRAVLRDIKTGRERVYDCSYNDAMKGVLIWLEPGDTVRLESNNYAHGAFFTPENSRLVCNYTELQLRKTQFENAKLRYEIEMSQPQKAKSK